MPVPVDPGTGLQISRFDKNKDGAIGKSEAPAFLEKHFDRLDLNNDGQLDADEVKKANAEPEASKDKKSKKSEKSKKSKKSKKSEKGKADKKGRDVKAKGAGKSKPAAS